MGKIVSGLVQTLIFLFVTALPQIIAFNADPKYGPYVCFALGFCAISIAVQQAYLSSISDQGNRRGLYLWGAASLVFLGISAILSSIATGGIQIDLRNDNYLVGGMAFYIAGLLSLYKFVVLYLQSGEAHPSQNAVFIFGTSNGKATSLDFSITLAFVGVFLLTSY